MATEPNIQRSYTAPCPGCGAPVAFRSLASTHAVCGFCQSTIVRDGDSLARIGKMAEVFEDYSQLQLMVQGKYRGVNFVVIGRWQYKSDNGNWSEWLVGLDDGSFASLSEDNGSFVWSVAQTHTRSLPTPEQWVVGNTTAIDGKAFSVASVAEVALMAAQGELPKLPALGEKFYVVELRSEAGEVISIDYASKPPSVSAGQAVNMEDLALSGLRDAQQQGGKQVTGQQFNCPNCGSTVNVKLAGSKSISCPSCNSLIDLTQGIGGQLSHSSQDEPVKPLIALGSTGTLQGKQWQVVGFQHRMGYEPDDPDEGFGWQEYLLYNAKAGFLFLVDATDGWSIVKPATGAPAEKGGTSVSYLGTQYKRQSSYQAETHYVAGEFYWPVKRGQKTSNQDYADGKSVLSREQSGKEITWSVGSKVDYTTIAAAFKIKDNAQDFKRADALPLSGGQNFGMGVTGWIIILIVILMLLFAFSSCSRSCDPQRENCSSSASSRSSGGSYGGYSGGGGHK